MSTKKRSVIDASLLEPSDLGQKKGKVESGYDGRGNSVRAATSAKREKTPKKKVFIAHELLDTVFITPTPPKEYIASQSNSSKSKPSSTSKTTPSHVDNPFQRSASPKRRTTPQSSGSSLVYSSTPTSFSSIDNPFQQSASPKPRVSKSNADNIFQQSASPKRPKASTNERAKSGASSHTSGSNGNYSSYKSSVDNRSNSNKQADSFSGCHMQSESLPSNLSSYFNETLPSSFQTYTTFSSMASPVQYRPQQDVPTCVHSGNGSSTYQVFSALDEPKHALGNSYPESVSLSQSAPTFTSYTPYRSQEDISSSPFHYAPSASSLSSFGSGSNERLDVPSRVESSYDTRPESYDYSKNSGLENSTETPSIFSEPQQNGRQDKHSPEDLFNPHKLHRAFEGKSYSGPYRENNTSTPKQPKPPSSQFEAQDDVSPSASDSEDWQESPSELARQNLNSSSLPSKSSERRCSGMRLLSWLPSPWFVLSLALILIAVVTLVAFDKEPKSTQDDFFLLEPPPVPDVPPIFERLTSGIRVSVNSARDFVYNLIFEPVRIILLSQVQNVVALVCCMLFFSFVRWRWNKWRQAKRQARQIADQIFTILSAQRNHIAIQHLQTKYAKEGISKNVWAAVTQIIESDSRVKRMQKRKGDMPIPRVCWIWESDLDYVSKLEHPPP